MTDQDKEFSDAYQGKKSLLENINSPNGLNDIIDEINAKKNSGKNIGNDKEMNAILNFMKKMNIYKFRNANNENRRSNLRFIITNTIVIINFIFFISLAIMNTLLAINVKEEPTNRIDYINLNINLINYKNNFQDTCNYNYTEYIEKGAFEICDIKMEDIKSNSNKVMILIFIFVGAFIIFFIIILFMIFNCSILKIKACETTSAIIIALMFLTMFVVFFVVFVYIIILDVNYYKSNFDEFENFSKCDYLNDKFKKDYSFVDDVKKYFNITFIINTIYCVVVLLEIILMIISFCKFSPVKKVEILVEK